MKKLDYETLESINEDNMIGLPLGNYYGGVYMVEHEGSYFMLLSDHSSTNGFEIDFEAFNSLSKFTNHKSFNTG